MPIAVSARPVANCLVKNVRTPQISLFFLAPSLLAAQSRPFSTTPSSQLPRDHNRDRGVSTVRRTGPRQALSVSKEPLPEPVLDPLKRSKLPVDEDHGLWDFFHSKDKPLNTPTEDSEHGRAWSVEELRHKSWEDLHSLWWVCCKVRNRIVTEAYDRKRVDAGYGDVESAERDAVVRRTQRAIKHVLTERFYAWEDARKLAVNDPEIDLSGDGQAYMPSELEDEGLADGDRIEEEFLSEEEIKQLERRSESAGNTVVSDRTQPLEQSSPTMR